MTLEERVKGALEDNLQYVVSKREAKYFAQIALAAIRETHVIAPKEPTEAMLDRAWHDAGESKEMRARTHAHYRRKYTAMLQAIEEE